MNWKDVRCGDTITVTHKDGGEVSGEVSMINGITAGIGGVYVGIEECTLQVHKRAYKDGDIAVYTSPYTGIWVGIYDATNRKFHDNSEEDNRTPLFSGYESAESIKIIGNVKDYRK